MHWPKFAWRLTGGRPLDDPRLRIGAPADRRPTPGSGVILVDSDLERSLDLIAAEFRSSSAAMMANRLRVLLARQVPISHLGPAPITDTARMVFADQTAILVRGEAPGDLGQLAVRFASHQRGLLTGIQMDLHRTVISLTIGGRPGAVTALGLDQAD